MKKTKIVCTLGPASTDENVMREMLLGGMNVARLNFSHGSHEMHKTTLERFRRVRDELKLPAAVMLDTKGPEIRLGTFVGGKAILKKGDRFTLTGSAVEGNSEIVSVTYADLAKQLAPGGVVLLDDGRIRLEVEETTDMLDCPCPTSPRPMRRISASRWRTTWISSPPLSSARRMM